MSSAITNVVPAPLDLPPATESPIHNSELDSDSTATPNPFAAALAGQMAAPAPVDETGGGEAGLQTLPAAGKTLPGVALPAEVLEGVAEAAPMDAGEAAAAGIVAAIAAALPVVATATPAAPAGKPVMTEAAAGLTEQLVASSSQTGLPATAVVMPAVIATSVENHLPAQATADKPVAAGATAVPAALLSALDKGLAQKPADDIAAARLMSQGEGRPLAANDFAPTLLAATANAPTTATTSPAPATRLINEFHVPVPVNEPRWGEAIGERMAWMIGQKSQSAVLHLSPPELGELTVQIRVEKGEAAVNFITPHASVRDALDLATPRLRELLGQNGLSLVDVNVSHQQSHPGQRDGQATRAWLNGGSDDSLVALNAPVDLRPMLGMVDLYA